MKSENLGVLNIALLYVGTVMGAGFASGREIWQFFGVFGQKGYIGVFLIGAMFISIGLMTSYIAREIGTNEIGKIIAPANNKIFEKFIDYFMATMLFSVLVTMSAAAGALFYQQFGIDRFVGGFLIVLFVIITVIGGLDRISGVFRLIMPVLIITVILFSIIIISNKFNIENNDAIINPSPLAPKWYIAALVYVSYNILAIIPIASTASIKAKSNKQAYKGTLAGVFFLTILAYLLLGAMLTEPGYSHSLDMPMLGYSKVMHPILNMAYTVILLFAIFASATTNYYGFTTIIKEGPLKNKIIIFFGIVAFSLGLFGFTNVVAYMLPIEGFMGFGIIILLTVNFFRIKKDIENIK